MQTALIWAFGIMATMIMLSAVVRRRHSHLVDLLKENVKKQTGLTGDSEATNTANTSKDDEGSPRG
jgi:hypothetical protein